MQMKMKNKKNTSLLLCMMLHNFYNDKKWNFAKYMGAIFMSIFGVCCELPAPYKDIKRCDSDRSRSNKAMYVIIGLAAAFPLLCVIIALLYSADAVFAQVIKNCFSEINFGTIIGCIFTFAFAFFASYCGVRYLNRKKIKEEVKLLDIEKIYRKSWGYSIKDLFR